MLPTLLLPRSGGNPDSFLVVRPRHHCLKVERELCEACELDGVVVGEDSNRPLIDGLEET
jgi:hypothetical protein